MMVRGLVGIDQAPDLALINNFPFHLSALRPFSDNLNSMIVDRD